MMKTEVFVSVNEISQNTEDYDNLCIWLDGNHHMFVSTTDSCNFDGLPNNIKTKIIEAVKLGQLPETFAIYIDT